MRTSSFIELFIEIQKTTSLEYEVALVLTIIKILQLVTRNFFENAIELRFSRVVSHIDTI